MRRVEWYITHGSHLKFEKFHWKCQPTVIREIDFLRPRIWRVVISVWYTTFTNNKKITSKIAVPGCVDSYRRVSHMRRSLTGLNSPRAPLANQKLVFDKTVVYSIIEGAENDGVHPVSPRFVFPELKRVTVFWVNFQTCDIETKSVLNRCVLSQWTTLVQGHIPKSQKLKSKRSKNLEKSDFHQVFRPSCEIF